MRIPLLLVCACALIGACSGPSRAERRAAEVDVCRGDAACLVADYGWSKRDADSVSTQRTIQALLVSAEERALRESNARAAARADSAKRVAAAKASARASAFPDCLSKAGLPANEMHPFQQQVHGQLVSGRTAAELAAHVKAANACWERS